MIWLEIMIPKGFCSSYWGVLCFNFLRKPRLLFYTCSSWWSSCEFKFAAKIIFPVSVTLAGPWKACVPWAFITRQLTPEYLASGNDISWHCFLPIRPRGHVNPARSRDRGHMAALPFLSTLLRLETAGLSLTRSAPGGQERTFHVCPLPAPRRILSHGRRLINIHFLAGTISVYSQTVTRFQWNSFLFSFATVLQDTNIGDGTKKISMKILNLCRITASLSSFTSIYMSYRVQWISMSFFKIFFHSQHTTAVPCPESMR